MSTRYSRQREAICEELMRRKDHPTADDLYRAVRVKYPKISLGTVYRNLMALKKEGKIMSINTEEGALRFDWDTSDHHHFICRECGAVMDLHMEDISEIKEIAGNDFDGKITGYSVNFYGICGNCLDKKSNN